MGEIKYYRNIPYLLEPEALVLGVPALYDSPANRFVRPYSSDFNDFGYDKPIITSPGELISKFAGQLCYLSFGENRTKDPTKYLETILAHGHGSVLEHINVTLLLWGIDRSVTHELVRHRAGFGFSQVSQRYVNGNRVRFVEPREYQDDIILHNYFLEDIELAVKKYEEYAARLQAISKAEGTPTELRKAVNQSARGILPNFTEAPIVVTANARAWRHFLEMRGNKHADTKIVRLATKVYDELKFIFPNVLQDFTKVKTYDMYGYEIEYLENKYRKV